MQNSMILNLQISHGLPLCLSGFTAHPPLNHSNKIADHDRRREAMKKQKSGEREVGEEDQEVGIEGSYERLVVEITESIESLMFDGDLDTKCLPCTAKAA